MFESTSKLIFEGVEEKVSKKGNSFKIVHFADPENYQKIEFFGDNQLEVKANSGQVAKVTLKAVKVGYNTNMNCLAVRGI